MEYRQLLALHALDLGLIFCTYSEFLCYLHIHISNYVRTILTDVTSRRGIIRNQQMKGKEFRSQRKIMHYYNVTHCLHMILQEPLGRTNRLLSLIRHGCIGNDVSNNYSIVACVFVTAVTLLPSRCLAAMGGFLPNRAVT
jgi:hypothetical protein